MEIAVNTEPRTARGGWHALDADEVVSGLHTDPARGLDAGEAARRLSQYGPKRLPEGRKHGAVMRFLLQFRNILVYILLGAGFVKLLVGLWLDAAVRHMAFVETFQAVISAAVAIIPEGLPALITVTLAIGCSAWRNAMPSSGGCQRWRPSARSHASAPTRPARSRSWR